MILPALGRFLSMLAVLGLAVVPIARPAMAHGNTAMEHHGNVPAATPVGMSHHATGADDHGCCPKQAPASDCDGNCLALCAAQILCNVTQVTPLAHRLGPAALLLPRNDERADGLRE